MRHKKPRRVIEGNLSISRRGIYVRCRLACVVIELSDARNLKAVGSIDVETKGVGMIGKDRVCHERKKGAARSQPPFSGFLYGPFFGIELGTVLSFPSPCFSRIGNGERSFRFRPPVFPFILFLYLVLIVL